MRVVVTGGAGFIGSNLAHFWAARHPSDEIVVVDALTYAGRRESLNDLLEASKIRLVVADICDPEATRAAVAGADLVIHLAAETHNDRAIRDPVQFVRSNVLGTAVLLEACRSQDVARFHHVSTDEVFGSLELEEDRRFDEATPYAPRGPYSASKAGADHLVRAWAATYGVASTISNCGNNFGPFQFPEKLIPLAITRILRGDRVPLYGDGRNVRDWIYVEDHCGAIERIALAGTAGRTYLVSAGVELPNREVVRRLLVHLGVGWDRVETVADRPGHDRRYALDASSLRRDLGWAPSHPFDEALAATVRWYRAHEAWWAPLLGAV